MLTSNVCRNLYKGGKVYIGFVSYAGFYGAGTDTVNGVSFSGLGTLPGMQSLVLTGTGTPTNSGSQTFTVKLGQI